MVAPFGNVHLFLGLVFGLYWVIGCLCSWYFARRSSLMAPLYRCVVLMIFVFLSALYWMAVVALVGQNGWWFH